MKRFLGIIFSVLIIALIVYFGYSFVKKEPIQKENKNEITSQKNNDETNVADIPKDVTQKVPDAPKKDPITYTAVGVYQGKIDTNFIEILMDGPEQKLISFKLSPELVKDFSSIALEEESIISFEYKLEDGQYTITKILK